MPGVNRVEESVTVKPINRPDVVAARPRKHTKLAVAAAAALALGVLPGAARAADVHWIALDGNWADPANWVWDNAGVPTNSVPVATDRALLDLAGGGTSHVNTDLIDDVLSISITNANQLIVESGGVVSTTAGGTTAADTIRIGDAGSGSAVVLDGGTLRNGTTGGLGADIYVGVLGGGVGTLTQSGATSLVAARDLRIGSDGGNGSATLSGGTTTTNWTIVGRTGGTGTLTVDGGTISAAQTTGARL